ncbi:MAG: ribonuclease HII [Candidatus Woesearchaeota archaeon]
MALVCGVDEAGRGPLLGPLVIAGVVADERVLDKLKSLGVKDSKLLTPKKREELFEQVKSIVESYEIIIVPPQEIDDALNSESLNLNWLEAIKTAMIINKLDAKKAYIDSPSTNLKAYADYMRIYVKDKDVNLICEHKADVKYVVVSAASILAKVTRDREIEKLSKRYGELGSGYPSDPVTKEFLKNNWDKHPEIFRKTWSSYKVYSGKEKNATLGSF